jgi:hypothetical protein
MIELNGDPANPSGVARPQRLASSLGDQRLIIYSGIALPEAVTEDGSLTEEVVVRLPGPFVDGFDAIASAHLAAISNSESDFAFAVDDARVTLDPYNGDVLLHVNLDVEAEGGRSELHRFAYHVTVRGALVTTRVIGTISWDPRWGAPRDPLPTFRIDVGIPEGLGFRVIARGYSNPARLAPDIGGTDQWQAFYEIAAPLSLGVDLAVLPNLIGGFSGPPAGFELTPVFDPSRTVRLGPNPPWNVGLASFDMSFLPKVR